jgi:beta-galactosidase
MKTRLLLFALAIASGTLAQPRQEILLNDGWQFSRDKIEWQKVNIPHDWAISGPFDKKWDLQTVAIEQNGEKTATEKSGRSGALPWIGKGHYKRTFNVPAGYQHAELIFDGAMAEPTIYINGKKAGYWAYGYNAFHIDITPYLNGGENQLEVDLNNMEESSRWYPGGGLYRPVTLVATKDARFATWQTFAYTAKANADMAEMNVTCKADGIRPEDKNGAEITLYDQKGHIVANSHCQIAGDGSISTMLDVHQPKMWSPETPYLYKLVTRLYRNRQLVDEQAMNVGIRTVKVSKEGGFQLNGQTRKLKGVCLHHDLGPLGAAINKAALVRQIKTMKEMGADAIRTAHNMPSKWQMEICDSLGMMVMAESFDMWEYPKCKNGYARFFKEWGERDIENLVLNHLNHPSIIMRSIGNEIAEQGNKKALPTLERLQDLCHKLDPSRPVTQGMDRYKQALNSGFAQAMDVPGFNYRVHAYGENIKRLPQGFLLGCETASTVSSRGIYKFPVEPSDSKTHADGQCSSYDVEWCSWSNLPDDDWVWQDEKPWVIGEFVWTGYDYLGEPTPYDEYWPSRSSYFGICDLAGLPKDRYYLYRSHWNKEKHTVHLLPHWTWPGRKGMVTPVYCYTDGSEAELFVNGKSQGRIRKNPASRLDRYRLRWNNVKYEPGRIEVVAYDDKGNEIGRDTRTTAGKPAAISATADRKQYTADGNDLAFVTVSLTDKDGNLIPAADNELTFEVSGEGCFEAACNGDATSIEPFTQPRMKLFSGQLVVILRTTTTPGTITLTIKDKKGKLSQSLTVASK